jgi:RimJ/RimL family protein N-acetyltransferase
VFNYHLQAALASERRRELRADGPADRWPWPGRPRNPASGRPAVLRDGSEVLIRPIRAADAPLLADGFARLSLRSRQMRFLTPKTELSAAELRYLTEVDHHDHEALGAVEHAGGRGVGIARYIRSAEDAQSAEIAVTVVDEWQGRGLGTELVAQLSERAVAEGTRRFTALAGADNVAVARLARNIGARFVGYDAATALYEIALVPGKEPGHEACPACSVGETRREATRVFVRPPGLCRG